eukprot:364206-Chlamydomonas_euryale.AAC.2
MSLASAIISLFQPNWCLEPAPLIETIVTKLSPWMYINLIVEHSQLYLPILNVHFGGPGTAGAAASAAEAQELLTTVLPAAAAAAVTSGGRPASPRRFAAKVRTGARLRSMLGSPCPAWVSMPVQHACVSMPVQHAWVSMPVQHAWVSMPV